MAHHFINLLFKAVYKLKLYFNYRNYSLQNQKSKYLSEEKKVFQFKKKKFVHLSKI